MGAQSENNFLRLTLTLCYIQPNVDESFSNRYGIYMQCGCFSWCVFHAMLYCAFYLDVVVYANIQSEFQYTVHVKGK